MKAELITNTLSDLTVVNAARVSFNKESEFDSNGNLHDRDVKLIRYLAKHDHWTPFSHPRITFMDSRFRKPVEGALYDHVLSRGLIYDSKRGLVRHSLYGWAQLYKKGYVYDEIAITLHRMFPISWFELTGFKDSGGQGAFACSFLNDEPPELCDITMRETVPIFVARQRFKHMVGFTYNEVSRRYVDDAPKFYMPDVWRSRPEGSVKQGSGDNSINIISFKNHAEGWNSEPGYAYSAYLEGARLLYESMIEGGIAPEQARMVLPQSMYTSYYVTGSLDAWARAYKQRIDSHAQAEIRALATSWDTIIRPLFPVSWDALTRE